MDQPLSVGGRRGRREVDAAGAGLVIYAVCGLPLFDFGRGRPPEGAENPDLWVMCDKRSGRGHT